MGDRLKLYHFLLPVIFIPICLFILATYGWIGYATLTERPGLNGDYYHYYNLTRPEFYIYNFVIAVTALGLIIFQAKYLVDKNSKYLKNTFWTFALFIGIIIICETYLQTRFTGKG